MDVESRAKLHQHFVSSFAQPDHPCAPATEQDLAQLATYLHTTLPTSYLQFMLRHGPVYCPSILRTMIDCGLEHPDLRQMLRPDEILTKCRELWCEWLPVGLYVFATDCTGNAFCFRQTKQPQDDAPVIFLSREHDQLLTLETFDNLLRAYLQHTHPAAKQPDFI